MLKFLIIAVLLISASSVLADWEDLGYVGYWVTGGSFYMPYLDNIPGGYFSTNWVETMGTPNVGWHDAKVDVYNAAHDFIWTQTKYNVWVEIDEVTLCRFRTSAGIEL